ncbi:unnamed protein product [uncultured bacterium]|nr:unnamed protein product [uncultured bacterium]
MTRSPATCCCTSAAVCSEVPLPQTLIISEAPFSLSNGFGVTMNTIFHGWPSERLRLIFTRAGTEPMRDVCPTAVFADVPGHWGRRYGAQFMLGMRPTWRGRYSPAWLTRTTRGWSADVVYALVFSGETLAFASWIAGRLRRPLVAHIADDGLETQKSGVTSSIRDLLAGAAARITISEEMRAEYAQRYGLDSQVLHNGAAAELLTDDGVAASPETYTVRYLGSVVPTHHFHAIEDIAEAVRRLHASGLPVRFELCGGEWTRPHAETLVDGRAVVYRGHVDRALGFDLLKTADLLVVPVNFDAEAFRHVRLSLPTKLAESLGSGTPTLVYGPAGSAPVEFCRRHGVGSVIDRRSVDHVADFIRTAMADRSAARLRAQRDRELIRRQYSADAVRVAFRAALCDAAGRAC